MKKNNAKNDAKNELINFLEHYMEFYKERYGGPVFYGGAIELEHKVIINKAINLLQKYGKKIDLNMLKNGPKY